MSETSGTTLTVTIDSDLEPIVPDFLALRHKDCGRIDDLLARGDLDEIYTIGHRMKGAGGSYGFDAISELGERIENGARGGEAPAITAAVRELRSYLARVRVVYVDME